MRGVPRSEAVAHPDDLVGLDLEPGLLPDLADHRLTLRLAKPHLATGNCPQSSGPDLSPAAPTGVRPGR